MDEGKDRQLSTPDIAGAAPHGRPADERSIVETRPGGTAAVLDEVQPQRPEPDRPEAPAAPLFGGAEAQGYRTRWDAIQTGFVDEPRRTVEEADALVADVMKHLADGFSKERAALEQQWDRGDKISTEDLRVALRRYRSFFQRLLSI